MKINILFFCIIHNVVINWFFSQLILVVVFNLFRQNNILTSANILVISHNMKTIG